MIRTCRITCQSVPAQIEGQLDDGRWFYFRARFNYAELGIGTDPDDAVKATLQGRPDGGCVAWIIPGRYGFRDLGDRWAGSMLEADDPRTHRLVRELLAEVTLGQR